jgi:hypothetical protein
VAYTDLIESFTICTTASSVRSQPPRRAAGSDLAGAVRPSRTVRDIIDLLGETAEELTVFCIHDADGYGTKIYEPIPPSSSLEHRHR